MKPTVVEALPHAKISGLYHLKGVPVTVRGRYGGVGGSLGVSVSGWVFGLVKEIGSLGICLLACSPG
jgi:hypothetical protein